MNILGLILVLALCGGGAYYEYTLQQKAIDDSQQQVTTLQGKIETLQAQEKKVEGEKKDLSKEVTDGQSKVAALTAKLQTIQGTLDEKQKALDLALHPPAPTATAAPPPADPNNLGTVTTLTEQSYQQSHLLKVDADGITISHSQGITKVLFGLLTPDLQKRFGFDPHQAAALSEAQVRFEEQQRQAAASAAPAGQ